MLASTGAPPPLVSISQSIFCLAEVFVIVVRTQCHALLRHRLGLNEDRQLGRKSATIAHLLAFIPLLPDVRSTLAVAEIFPVALLLHGLTGNVDLFEGSKVQQKAGSWSLGLTSRVYE